MRATLFLLVMLAAGQRQWLPAATVGAVSAVPLAGVDTVPSLRLADRVRLAEAFRLDSTLSEQLWSSWKSAPFAVLLVTPSHEFLVGHPYPTPDFRPLETDPLLAKSVHVRPRVFATGMLATFPAVAGMPTIVMGLPEQVGLTSTRWVLTVLHEHFHQLQSSQPNYFRGVESLGLARGDTTEMWMLNYAFPYESPDVQRALENYAAALADLLDSLPASRPIREAAAVVDATALGRATRQLTSLWRGWRTHTVHTRHRHFGNSLM